MPACRLLFCRSHRAMALKQFHIGRTETSPEVEVDMEHGVIDITGRSLPMNCGQFYERVYRWLEEYLKEPQPQTTVNMRLDYLDTSSSKHFYQIFERLSTANGDGHRVQVNWHYEIGDEEMAEAGKDYQSFFSLDFQLIEVKDLF